MGNCDNSSVGRAAASQAAGRGFEPRLSLNTCHTDKQAQSNKCVKSGPLGSFLGEPKGGFPRKNAFPHSQTQNLFTGHLERASLDGTLRRTPCICPPEGRKGEETHQDSVRGQEIQDCTGTPTCSPKTRGQNKPKTLWLMDAAPVARIIFYHGFLLFSWLSTLLYLYIVVRSWSD